ncbi:MAG: cytochrome P450 [Candidatus Microthrix sp.]|uniref:Cytochrome P450 n=1 Tax=Candidatus Neomicrothrix subdominans TaxID=2954438 RepID=A0A936N8F8_9ACTN|nr:cytochrome P450 [Candidatus Microthrix sp.]MBK7165574.1 cytochrome P450 [Candidatus Microthrix sp.]MBK9295532.1 cytochrome P450 [Candidatus Microthrix subdominans]MBK9558928.1 cytochrome P450 [Candidatus Microthrix sp.]MBP9065503.1 cytochrome P450 [Candidatus Microthrix sp.]
MTSKTGSATTASPTTPPADAQPSTAQPTGLDLLDPELYRGNPQELWAELLAGDTLARDRNGLWAVTQHAHLREAERRSADFTSGPGYRSLPSADENNMIALDDPEHLRQRRLVSGRFTPRAVRTHETWLRAAIGELLDAATDADTATGRGEMEVIDELASQLPCRLTARLLGFPEESWRDIKEWSEALMRIDEVERDQHAALGLFNAVVAFNGVLQPLAEQRRAEPADDLVSVWANADVDGFTYDPTRLYHEVGLFIAGGAETTRTAIAHGLRAFCDHPEQWEYLAAHPEAIPTAVEEVIRFVTPLNNFFRTVDCDTTLAGTDLATGDRLILLYPAANRDPRVFNDPTRFDITRSPNPHLGFGQGTHFCVGANLARYELTILFEELTRRIRDLTPLSEPDVEANMFARAVRSFRLGFALR